MDWEFINTHLPFYVEAAWLTIRIAAVGIVLSFLIGLIVSIIKYLKLPILIQIADFYVELSRNTPLLVQLFFLYFGLPKIGIVLSSESCAIIGLAFLGGSYMAEAFRSGLENVEKIQTLSGLSLGFTKSQIFRHIVLPQAVSTSVPLFLANVIFLIKETSVFSVVALADLMFVAKDLIGIYYKTDEALLMLVLAYLVILLPISIVASYLERRVRYAGFGDTGTISG
ncbi:amino acid ABC transporter permease [Kineothrix sp. MB12-C1]|uniref:amino acid ABC transporter permease n=1 Tax=Kineothrix sp. MB12-C1 TaxID=3070215 RepID=UPI0027D22BCF|nr:amino acid ABC transporter permease [Kineothrix sp. MB12-C1]WMC92380.1 amino acid ABC transporter permease [Kineothrix sp. MB12-C1]